MNLKQTVEDMCSADYKQRFKAEYDQLDIRMTGLVNMLNKWDKGKLDFTPTCPRGIYDLQLKAMQDYLRILLIRAQIEKVDLQQANG